MKTTAKVLTTLMVGTLVLTLVILPAINHALAAYQPASGWTKYGADLTLDAQYVIDAHVLKEGATYRMWYTRLNLNENLEAIFTRMGALNITDIADAFLELRQNDLLNTLAGLSAADVLGLTGSMTTVIGYATSPNGVTWTVDTDPVLSGGGTLLDGVGAPAVINDGGTYKMWYTRTESDLTQATLAGILADLDGTTAQRQAAIEALMNSTRTVIGYATSPDGETWTVQDPQVHPATDGSVLTSVGAPAVMNDGGTYRMWYTGGTSDLTVAQWAAVLTDTASYDLAALLGLLDGSAAVIGYATSPDGLAWTVQDNDVVPGNTALWESAGAPAVLKTDGLYEMWFTGVTTNLISASLANLLTEISALGLGALWNTLLTGGVFDFLTEFLTKDLTNIENILGSTASVISYATSADGATWEIQKTSDLVGSSGQPWSGVGSPSIALTGSTYQMWFTRGIESLGLAELLGAMLGTEFPIGFAYFAPPPVGGGGGGPPPRPRPALPPGTTDLTGKVDIRGSFLEEVVASSEDGLSWVTVPQGTTGLAADGQPLTQISIVETPIQLPQPRGKTIIGLPYVFGPAGASFDPPITITLTYDPSLLPEGVDETELVLAVWDPTTGAWIELDSVVDPAANTISAQVSGFSSFAILAPIKSPAAFQIGNLLLTPDEVEVGETLTASVNVSNTGDLAGTYELELRIDGEVAAIRRVTLEGGESATVSFRIFQVAAGTYTVTINTLSAEFTVTREEPVEVPPPKADIVTSNLSIAPPEAQLEQTVIVSVLVTNRGGAEGSYEVKLNIDGVEVESKMITLPGNTSRTVTFTTAKNTPGTYTVSIDNLSRTFTVRAPVEIPTTPINWWLTIGIVASVTVITAVVVIIIMRRRAYG